MLLSFRTPGGMDRQSESSCGQDTSSWCRFSGSSWPDTQKILQWQELVDADYECAGHMPVMLDGGAEVRVFRRRSGAVSRASRDISVEPGLGDLGGDDIQPGDRQDRAHQPCGDRNKSEDLDEREIGKCDGERDKRHR